MTVARLRMLQIEMWNERVETACNNKKSDLSRDLQVVMRRRGLTRETMDLTNMTFCKRDFPMLPYPTPHDWPSEEYPYE